MESLSPHSRPVKLPIEASPHRAALATAFNYSQTVASYFIGRRRLPSFDRPWVSSPALRKNLPSRAILRGKGRPGWTRLAVHRFSNSSTIFRYYTLYTGSRKHLNVCRNLLRMFVDLFILTSPYVSKAMF